LSNKILGEILYGEDYVWEGLCHGKIMSWGLCLEFVPIMLHECWLCYLRAVWSTTVL